MSQFSFLAKVRSWARKTVDLLAGSAPRARTFCRKRERRRSVLLQVTPLEDRVLLSNVLGYGGQDLNETVLTPANVQVSTFGQVFTNPLDGSAIKAEPLYVSGVNVPGQGTHNVVYVGTSDDNLYALDSVTGNVLWEDSFGTPVAATDFGFLQYGGGNRPVTTFGIRGTPAIDLSTGTIFVVAFTKVPVGSPTATSYDFVYTLYDVYLSTGQNAVAPVVIAEASEPASAVGLENDGTSNAWCDNMNYISGPTIQDPQDNAVDAVNVNGTPTIQFNACAEVETTALTIANGSVYVCFAGLIESVNATNADLYHGWVLGYSTTTLSPTAVFCDTPNGSEGGIWTGAGPLAVDAQGNLYVTTGNGDFSNTENGVPGPTLNAAGFPPDGNYGDTVIKLAVDPTTSPSNQNVNGWGLTAVDYFTPDTQLAQDGDDEDQGASPAYLIPNPDGTAADPDLLVQGAKPGVIYVMDPDNMGKYNATSNDVIQQFQENVAAGADGQVASAGYFNGTVYLTGSYQYASAYSVVGDQLELSQQSANIFGYAGADPVVSANGNSNGIVWELDYATNQLFAYSASNLSDLLWSSNQAPNGRDKIPGTISEFLAPAVANGMVYVGSVTGGIIAWGELPAAASFSGTDTTTQGNWEGAYGADGSNVIGSKANYPSYATVTPAGNSTVTWAASTTNVNALQIPGGTGRVAAAWEASTSFTITVDLTDGGTHEVSLYLDDYNNAGISESIEVLNAVTGAVLNTQTVSSFSGGEYLTWELKGEVEFVVTALQGPDAVVSGLFFGGATPNTAVFVGTDTTTQGSWKTAYGADGENVIGSTSSYPLYASVTPTGNSTYTWAASTTAVSALQIPGGSTGRVAAAWEASTSFTINVNLTNDLAHEVSLYLVDFDGQGRSESIEVLNGATGAVLSGSQTVSNFSGGEYLTWDLTGDVEFVITCLQGPNAVVSGLFFGAPVAATLAATDTATQGKWIGTYGSNGYNVVGTTTTYPGTYPSYASVSVTTSETYTWNSFATHSVQALQIPDGLGYVAAAWVGKPTTTINLDLTDNLSHVVSLYFLDYDNQGRSESVEVLNAGTGAVLSSQTVSNFAGGEYLTWDLTGNVEFVITKVAGPNSVVSGLFFGPLSSSTTVVDGGGTYNGTGFPATATASGPAGLSDTNLADFSFSYAGTGATSYGPSASVPVNAGAYTATATYLGDATLAGSISSAVPFTISPAGSTTTVVDAGGAYNGTAYPATAATASGSGGVSDSNLAHFTFSYAGTGTTRYGPSASAPVNAGTYTVTATYLGTANLAGGTSSPTPFTISPASSMTTVVDAGGTYTGNAFPATAATASGTGGLDDTNLADFTFSYAGTGSTNYGPSASAPINAGTYTVTATYLGAANYSGSTSSAVPFTISPVSPILINTDPATQGAWQGAYGTDGYDVIGDSSSFPTYAQISTAGIASYTWASTTTNPSALERASTSGQVAAALFGNSFTVGVNLTDGQVHSVAFYLLDWGSTGRSESISIYNATTGLQLGSSLTESNFGGGLYVTFRVQGNLNFKFTDITGANAVLSGIFLDGTSAAAAYVSTDTATQGSWQGSYGSDGYNVAGDSVSYPAYAQVSMSGNSFYTWAASTTNPVALERASGSGQVAATWFSNTSFTVNVDLLDSRSHLVSLYLLDWDKQGRVERIDVLNAATGAVLTSQTASSFGGGEYLTFEVSGNVEFRITNLVTGANAVLSGLFFGEAAAGAAYVNSDATTQGNWQGAYGSDGYNVAGNSVSYPPYAQVGLIGDTLTTWTTNTTNASALEQASGSGRVAAAWHSNTSLAITVDLLGGQSHSVSLYLLDWDRQGRSESIEVLNAATGAVLNSQTVSNFTAGEYLTWNLTGDVEFLITNLAGPNAVVSGIFFGGATPTTSPGSIDTTTQGSWQGVYGADGQYVIGTTPSYPSYAAVNASGNSSYTWAASTTDVRALQVPLPGSGRIAATWYAANSFAIDVNMTGTSAHQISLYVVDFDNAGRRESIEVLNAGTGAVLSSQTVSNFTGGEYLAWNLTGNVEFLVTNLAGPNAVVSGIFFGGDPPVPPAAPSKANSMSVLSGSQQTALVTKTYGRALQTLVLNSAGKPVAGVSVTFTAPTFGPGGAFGGKSTVTVVTAGNGIATAPAFTANTLAGNFSVLATIKNGASAIFALANKAGPPAHVTASAGTGQSANPGSNFPIPLAVVVTDAFGNPISGLSVTFSAQTSTGAGAAFAGGTSKVAATTSSQGLAVAPILKANSKPGVFTVIASIAGLLSDALFTLTNL